MTGDYGSAGDLTEKGIVAAMKYADGRGPRTMLYDLFCARLGIKHLEDIIEFFYIDRYRPITIGDVAPVVFEAANRGDAVALRILRKTGKEVAADAVACIRHLFDMDDPVPIVLGGSVFMRGENPTLVDTLTGVIRGKYPKASIVKLSNEPCLGALLWSLDTLRGKPTAKTTARKMAASLRRVLRTLPPAEPER